MIFCYLLGLFKSGFKTENFDIFCQKLTVYTEFKKPKTSESE